MDTATHLSPLFILIACSALMSRVIKKLDLPFSQFHLYFRPCCLPPSLPKLDSDHCLETARSDLLIWQHLISCDTLLTYFLLCVSVLRLAVTQFVQAGVQQKEN